MTLHERASSLAEVALTLGITVPALRRKIAQGELPAVQLRAPAPRSEADSAPEWPIADTHRHAA